MAQAMGQAGLADEMARLQRGLRSARPDLQWGGRAADGRRQGRWASPTPPARSPSSPTSTSSTSCSARTTPARASTTSTRSSSSARSGRAGRRRHGPAAPHRDASCASRATCSAAATGCGSRPRALRRLGSTALRRVFDVLESRGRGGHDVRDAGAAGEVTGASREWRSATSSRSTSSAPVRNAVLRTRRGTPVAADRRGLRGRRDRAPLVGRGRAARRHVVLDGAARHVGRGEDDRARAALAGHHQVPAGRDRDHRLQRLRAGDVDRRARRARLGPRAGHQPAARADAGPAASSTSTAAPSR